MEQQRAPRSVLLSSLFFLLSCFLGAAPALAQGGFGIGGRLAMIRGNVNDASAVRFLGGQIRLRASRRTALELSLDRHREETPDLTQRVTDYPLQASILLYPVRSTFSPYVLGGFGWYTHQVQTLTGNDVSQTVSTHKTGYHAGFGAEIMMGRHAGIHADYRYTFLHFGDSSSSGSQLSGTATGTSSLASRILPSYDGSMWTAGFTLYF